MTREEFEALLAQAGRSLVLTEKRGKFRAAVVESIEPTDTEEGRYRDPGMVRVVMEVVGEGESITLAVLISNYLAGEGKWQTS